MIAQTTYFEAIRTKAKQRWDQLEHDPELAGPWHQLFKQIQSPRHVVSELLQNADDADATEAHVKICDGEFIFSHNGIDFTEEHFLSLCRFGYSNKRALHTIGFRGIGFKSTFSLGDEVRLFTPTLSVAFHCNRFTEPVWITQKRIGSNDTEIRVKIKDERLQRELEKNFMEWKKSPASLLFFRSIRCLQIGEQEVRWISAGKGPVNNSEWMKLSSIPDKQYLLLRSEAKDFPDNAIEEIQQERMVPSEEETSFPPSRVEIVLGMPGRLFVVLPTGVTTNLPFACNAPFIQDPARVKIKDPEISPTNRWLLKRVGELAANAMLEWLHTDNLDIDHRAKAYGLFPDVDRDDNSIEGCCATIVEEAFEEVIQNEPFLLTEDKTLVVKNECISVPSELLAIWSPHQISKFFVTDNRFIAYRNISSDDLKKLIHWNFFEELSTISILNTLQSKYLPKPSSWRRLLVLWNFISEHLHDFKINYSYYRTIRSQIKMLPVQGKDVLYCANDVVRLGEKNVLQSDDDWEFLSNHLHVINSNWLRFITKQKRDAERFNDNEELDEQAENASEILKALGLDTSSDVSRVIEKVAKEFFSEKQCSLKDCVRLAQIAAKLGATVQESFQFVTRDLYWRHIDHHIIADINHDMNQFVTDEWYETHVLHEDYWKEFISCSEQEWRQWITSVRSKVLRFVPLSPMLHKILGKYELLNFLHQRQFYKELEYRYKTREFVIDDWDFDHEHWCQWTLSANGDGKFWGNLFTKILTQPKGYWANTLSAKISQVATSKNIKSISDEKLLPSWIMKFRSLPCLRDTRGIYRQPAELLRRTSETEALLDVEPFINAEDDNEQNRPLLIMLGVRDTPTGPDRLLERIRALATADTSLIYEIEKWYHRLDQIIDKCSTEEFIRVRNAFANEKIILAQGSVWTRTAEVFLESDEAVIPNAHIIPASVRHLTLWRKIGVADRPTDELAIRWIKGLPSGNKLAQDELNRLRSLLSRYAERIWHECKHWLNLEGEWIPITQLSFKLTMQSLVPWGHLFPCIKQATADFQRLSAELSQQRPFADLPSLSTGIEDRIQNNNICSTLLQEKDWIIALGNGLQRIIFDDESKTQRIRFLAERLAKTRWKVTSGLKTIPYIDGTPAGTARSINVLWKDQILYVENHPIPKLFKQIAQELGRPFDSPDITEAIKACVEREPKFIDDYLATNFTLISQEEFESLQSDESTSKDKDKQVSSDQKPTLEEKPMQDGEDDEEPPTFPSSEPENDQDEKNQPVEEINDPPPYKPRSTPTKPKLIEQFAFGMGYRNDGTDRFCRQDGSFIRKNDSCFPWEEYSSSGELIKCYCPKDHCIEHSPLSLEAEVWELCIKNPDTYALILNDIHGRPVKISGHRLNELCKNGKLTLYPATYRLVYNQNKDVDNHGQV